MDKEEDSLNQHHPHLHQPKDNTQRSSAPTTNLGHPSLKNYYVFLWYMFCKIKFLENIFVKIYTSHINSKIKDNNSICNKYKVFKNFELWRPIKRFVIKLNRSLIEHSKHIPLFHRIYTLFGSGKKTFKIINLRKQTNIHWEEKYKQVHKI